MHQRSVPNRRRLPRIFTMALAALAAIVVTRSIAAPSALPVAITGFAYQPASLSVPIGATVTWTNGDAAPHTVTAEDRSFESSPLARGQSFEHTFSEAGTIRYLCAIHPGMRGTVTVQPEPAARAR